MVQYLPVTDGYTMFSGLLSFRDHLVIATDIGFEHKQTANLVNSNSLLP